METSDYIIRGGAQGRERLRVLSRVMQPATHAFLESAGLRKGMRCLELGCGGGDVAFDMAQMVGPKGFVTATDIDEVKLEIARGEAVAQGLGNVDFRLADITRETPQTGFDFVHARFLLTHLPDPPAALQRMHQALRPGGIVAVEDIDCRGFFHYPPCAAFDRCIELYSAAARGKGSDPDIGGRLPALAAAAGFRDLSIHVAQQAGLTGEVKVIVPLTLENTSEALIAQGLATAEEVNRLVDELYDFAQDSSTLMSMPRIVQVSATR